MPTKKQAKPKETHLNNALPTLYVDLVDTRHRKDGFNYLSFSTNLPDRIVEQVRLMIEDESLRTIIDDMCQTINYFPKKPSKKEGGPSK
jgi:hypothetical protein